jgi:hypothetical protein
MLCPRLIVLQCRRSPVKELSQASLKAGNQDREIDEPRRHWQEVAAHDR